MQINAFLALAFAALAAAAPTKRAGQPQVTLNINTNPLTAPKQKLEQVDVVIGELTSLNNVHASEISFAFGGAIEVDVDTVQCRAYKDAAGTVPGSAPFTNAKEAKLSTNLVQVDSVLCYVYKSSD